MDLHPRFRDLVAQHYKSVWAYVTLLTNRSDETEDLVHQAFLLAFDRLADGVEFTGDPGRWIRGTARNLAFAWWREKRKTPGELLERLGTVTEGSEGPFARAAKAEVSDALRDCLGKLSGEERELVRRRYEDGDRITRIAEDGQASAVSLRARLYRIRQALKRCVEAQLGEGVLREA